MKIESHRPASETEASQRAEGSARRSPRAEGQSSKGDRVEVSDGTKKVQQIVAEASKGVSVSEVRPEKVERARELLESGRLGKDHEALASAIIDDLIDQS
jgi:flagellar biosynthesis anti-sigma factor FlgM